MCTHVVRQQTVQDHLLLTVSLACQDGTRHTPPPLPTLTTTCPFTFYHLPFPKHETVLGFCLTYLRALCTYATYFHFCYTLAFLSPTRLLVGAEVVCCMAWFVWDFFMFIHCRTIWTRVYLFLHLVQLSSSTFLLLSGGLQARLPLQRDQTRSQLSSVEADRSDKLLACQDVCGETTDGVTAFGNFSSAASF